MYVCIQGFIGYLIYVREISGLVVWATISEF